MIQVSLFLRISDLCIDWTFLSTVVGGCRWAAQSLIPVNDLVIDDPLGLSYRRVALGCIGTTYVPDNSNFYSLVS